MPNPLPHIMGQMTTPPKTNVDLTGQTILVTGANSGLGFEAVKHLISLKCDTVVITCRTVEKGETAKKEIMKFANTCNRNDIKIVIVPLEMTSFASVAAATEELKVLPRLDAAILNAGVEFHSFTTAEGYEATITVNVISTFLLATLLVPILRSSELKHKTRPIISIVGSLVHFFANTKDLTSPPEGQILTSLSDPKKADMKARYFLSKLPVMMMVQHMAEMLTVSTQKNPETKPLVIINNAAPGLCDTGLFRNDTSAANRAVVKMFGRTAEVGGRTLVHGGTAGKETHGAYLTECKVKDASPFVRSEEGRKTAERLWRELEAIYEGVRPGCTKEL